MQGYYQVHLDKNT